MQNSKQLSTLKLLLVTVVFVFPLVAGSLLYHFRDSIHFKTLNHGVLINPPITVNDLWKSDNKWQIVYAPKNCCDASCEKTMFLLHQLHLILGNDNRRTSLVLLVDKACPKADPHDFQEVALAASQFSTIKQDKIYLVDPQSHLFMSYESNTDLMNVYNDLKRVLEVSQIG